MNLVSRLGFSVAALGLCSFAHASFLTTNVGFPAHTLVDFNGFMPGITTVGVGGLSVGSGVTLFPSTVPAGTVRIGAQSFSVINNGDWTPAQGPYVSLNGFAGGGVPGSMTFVLPTTASQVLVSMNFGFVNPNVLIEALTGGGIVLESYNLLTAPGGNIITPGGINASAFRGISRPSADIAQFRVTGDFIALDDFRFVPGGSSAPEPGTLAFFLAGIPLLNRLNRRRKAQLPL